MHTPMWVEVVDGEEYHIIVSLPGERARHWANALTFAKYRGLEWVVCKDSWLVGCQPGTAFRVPSFDGVEAPEWVFDNT